MRSAGLVEVAGLAGAVVLGEAVAGLQEAAQRGEGGATGRVPGPALPGDQTLIHCTVNYERITNLRVRVCCLMMDSSLELRPAVVRAEGSPPTQTRYRRQ